jgi:hypothetical protein
MSPQTVHAVTVDPYVHCTSGKRSYGSRAAAKRYAVAFRRSNPWTPLTRPYLCTGCGAWHNTKQVAPTPSVAEEAWLTGFRAVVRPNHHTRSHYRHFVRPDLSPADATADLHARLLTARYDGRPPWAQTHRSVLAWLWLDDATAVAVDGTWEQPWAVGVLVDPDVLSERFAHRVAS